MYARGARCEAATHETAIWTGPYVNVTQRGRERDTRLGVEMPNGYNIYHNNSHINKSDGVVVYVKKDVTQTTNVIELGKLKILNTIINLKSNSHLEISSMYRSHDLHNTEFILKVNQYLQLKRNVLLLM